jgi:hypothetical protein
LFLPPTLVLTSTPPCGIILALKSMLRS